MAKSTEIVFDQFNNIVVDVQKIQAKPNMYISYTGERAYMHLIREAVNNCIDEYKNKNNIGDGSITMYHDEAEGKFYIEDTGRGIQFDQLENSCTIIHSGSKMIRKQSSAGENGVGLTAINALSEEFEITSYHNGEMKMLTFKNGIKVSDKTAKTKDDKHGLLVAFKPSKVFLGTSCVLNTDELEDWLLKQSFIQPEFIKFKLTLSKVGRESTIVKTFQNKTGLGGIIPKLQPNYNLVKTPIVLSNSDTIMETVYENQEDGSMKEVSIERSIDLTIAFNYNPDSQETVRYSFCNDIETIEDGIHVESTVVGIINYFRKKYREEASKYSKKDEPIEVTNNDILYGLCLVVRMNTDYSTGLFTSQTKHKMDNNIFSDPVRKMVVQSLTDYFNMPENKKTLAKCVGMIRDNIKARLAATKTRKTSKNTRKSLLETSMIEGYTAPNFLDKAANNNDYKLEIYIVEGDSAGGSARAGRYNPDVQGTLGLTGKPNNVVGWSDEDVEKKAKDIHELFNDILGCGYGKHFDISKLVYDKILMMPDADVDGGHIAGLITADIYYLAKPIIEQGHLYRVITPLYRLYQNEHQKKVDRSQFLYSKDEFFDVYEQRASEFIKLKFELDDENFISKANMKRFLQTNRDYFECLDTISSHYTIHPDIVEFIARNPKDFREKISTEFPELKYNSKDDSVIGSYDNNFYEIMIDNIILDKIKYLTKVINDGNDGISLYHTFKKYKTKDKPAYLGKLTIGQIMLLCQDQEPRIRTRYKGQGEMDASLMKVLAMNPESRRLLRMTIHDVEETAAVMDNLFLKDRADVRRQMVQNSEIGVYGIDN